jgi:phospholipase C
MYKIDPGSIDVLHYYQDMFVSKVSMMGKIDVMGLASGVEVEQTSALYRAIQVGNQKCVDTLLEYLSKIDSNGSKNISHIMTEMSETHSFAAYFGQLP